SFRWGALSDTARLVPVPRCIQNAEFTFVFFSTRPRLFLVVSLGETYGSRGRNGRGQSRPRLRRLAPGGGAGARVQGAGGTLGGRRRVRRRWGSQGPVLERRSRAPSGLRRFRGGGRAL